MTQAEKDAIVAQAEQSRDAARAGLSVAQDAARVVLADAQAKFDAAEAAVVAANAIVVTPPVVVPPAFTVGTMILDALGRRLHGLVAPPATSVEIFLGSSSWGYATVVNGAWSWAIPASATGPRVAKGRGWHRDANGRIVLDGWLDNTVSFDLSGGPVPVPLPPPPPPAPPPPPPPAPPPPAGTYTATITKFATRHYDTEPADTEAENATWVNMAYDTIRDVFYNMGWHGVLERFAPLIAEWEELTASLGGGIHNRTFAFDPYNDRLWIGFGTGTWNGSPPNQVAYIDLKTMLLVQRPMAPNWGSECAVHLDADRKRFVIFGGWGGLPLHTMALDPVGPMVRGPAGGPVWGVPPPVSSIPAPYTAGDATAAQRMTHWRGDVDTKRKRSLFVDHDGTLWQWPHDTLIPSVVPTTGGPPPLMSQYVYHEHLDALIGWASGEGVAGGASETPINKMVILPLTTNAWQTIAWTGDTPLAAVYVGFQMDYDPPRKRVLLHVTKKNYGDQVATYAINIAGGGGTPVPLPPPPAPPPPPPPPPPPQGGTLTFTSIPVAPNPLAPYGRSSKHTNMAGWGEKILITGGDWEHSATDGSWVVEIATGATTMLVSKPVYPTLPAPHALQDGAGFALSAKRGKFLLWPGAYAPYTQGAPTGMNWTTHFDELLPAFPLLHYARGIWWLDPVSGTFEQDLRLFAKPGSGTGCLYGGVLDEVRDEIVALRDSSASYAIVRWNIETAEFSTVPITGFSPGRGYYFQRGKYVLIGRHLYFVGFGTNGNRSDQVPRFWRVHLDTAALEELAPPPIEGPLMNQNEVRIAVSNDKIIFPFTTQPDGVVHALLTYDIAAGVWKSHAERPAVGNFVGNSLASLDGRRVALAGALGALPQTHVYLIEA